MAKKAAKGEATRSETLTIRLTPKIKYGLELLARKQHRTIAGVVEWAIERGIKASGEGLLISEPNSEGSKADTTILEKVWDYHPTRRLCRLANLYPEMLSYEEHKLWYLVSNNAYYWKTIRYQNTDHLVWDISKAEDIVVGRVEADQPILDQIVRDEANQGSLPHWIPADVVLINPQLEGCDTIRKLGAQALDYHFTVLSACCTDEGHSKLTEKSKSLFNKLNSLLGEDNMEELVYPFVEQFARLKITSDHKAFLKGQENRNPEP